MHLIYNIEIARSQFGIILRQIIILHFPVHLQKVHFISRANFEWVTHTNNSVYDQKNTHFSPQCLYRDSIFH